MRLLRRREVEAMVGLGTSSIYRRMRAGQFPVAVALGGAVRWRLDEVTAWIDSRERATGEGPRAAPPAPALGVPTPHGLRADIAAAKVGA